MPGPILLYALPPRVLLAGARRDPLLREVGAPAAGGIFVASDRHLARQGIASHKVAMVDPVDAEFA
jgi:hypothetical protein